MFNYFVMALVGMFFSWTITDRKGRNPVGWAILGFVCPLIGILIAWSLDDRRVPALAPRNEAAR